MGTRHGWLKALGLSQCVDMTSNYTKLTSSYLTSGSLCYTYAHSDARDCALLW
jgi:hypothetical protein